MIYIQRSGLEQLSITPSALSSRQRVQMSYHKALSNYRLRHRLARVSWVTWLILVVTVALWCWTAYQTALAVGAHGWQAVLQNILSNAIAIQDKDNNALANVLVKYGAKDNDLIQQGQYWRFVTPLFLHANALHVGLNMLNFLVLGIFLERLVGHLRLLLIYIVTGVVSIIASYIFSPQEVSVGASGAIFGLVGAYSIFVLVHRNAFRHGGIPALLWLVVIIGINLGLGFAISNVDNYAHIGGLASGFLLGWFFMPVYQLSPTNVLIDKHSLRRRWLLAGLTIVSVLIFAYIAVRYT